MSLIVKVLTSVCNKGAQSCAHSQKSLDSQGIWLSFFDLQEISLHIILLHKKHSTIVQNIEGTR